MKSTPSFTTRMPSRQWAACGSRAWRGPGAWRNQEGTLRRTRQSVLETRSAASRRKGKWKHVTRLASLRALLLKISQFNKCRIFCRGWAIGRRAGVRPAHIGAQGTGEQIAAAQGKFSVVPVTAVGT